jgi:hypothetical protein
MYGKPSHVWDVIWAAAASHCGAQNLGINMLGAECSLGCGRTVAWGVVWACNLGISVSGADYHKPPSLRISGGSPANAQDLGVYCKLVL